MLIRRAFAIIVIVIAAAPFATPNLAAAKVAVHGDGTQVKLADSREALGDRARLLAQEKPPPGPRGKPLRKWDGRPRIVERGRGDRPTAPRLTFVEGFGTCVRGGTSVTWYDPLLDTPEQISLSECPSGPAGKGRAGPPPPSPRDAAFQAWYWETTLPDPSLATSPPDGAITGLDLYLSIGGPQHLTFDVPALGYLVHLEVTSVYDIHWGDP